MTDPWDMTPAQRMQFREAQIEAKRRQMAEKPAMQQQYGVRWPTGAVFSYPSREAAEGAIAEDDRHAGVLVVHEYEPGTSNSSDWREV